MNAGMKMLMLSNRGGNSNGGWSGGQNATRGGNMGNAYDEMRGEYGRSEYGHSEMEMRGGNRSGGGNRGGRGGRGGARSEMDYGRAAYDEMENNMGRDEMEIRQGGQRYRRDSRGRFRSERDMNMGDDGDMNAHYPAPYPLIPPIYEVQDNYPRMNKIGFYSSGEMDQEYQTYANSPKSNEMEHRTSQTMMGHGKSTGDMRMTKEMADEWMNGLQNEDGTRGPHWKIEQVKQVMAQKGISMDPVQFFVILNAIYSDYYKVLKKHGVGDKLDVYVDLACAWLNDKDAVPEKAAAYYEHVVKH